MSCQVLLSVTADPKPIGGGAPETAGTGAVAAQRENIEREKKGWLTNSARQTSVLVSNTAIHGKCT